MSRSRGPRFLRNQCRPLVTPVFALVPIFIFDCIGSFPSYICIGSAVWNLEARFVYIMTPPDKFGSCPSFLLCAQKSPFPRKWKPFQQKRASWRLLSLEKPTRSFSLETDFLSGFRIFVSRRNGNGDATKTIFFKSQKSLTYMAWLKLSRNFAPFRSIESICFSSGNLIRATKRRCLSRAKNRWYMAWILKKGYFHKPKEADLSRGLGFHVFLKYSSLLQKNFKENVKS